jgi:hypothetical protein
MKAALLLGATVGILAVAFLAAGFGGGGDPAPATTASPAPAPIPGPNAAIPSSAR